MAEKSKEIPKQIKSSYSAKHRSLHPEKWKETLEQFRMRHRIRRNAEAREAYAKNSEKGRARTKQWRERNPEGVRAHAMTRWARKKGSSGSYTVEDIRFLFEAQKGRCINCLASLNEAYHVDHVQPLSRGGLNVRSNLQLLCPPCNLSKHALDPFEWAQRNGRLL
jgi:5-methylcytosine-specific restriction endonuclease McrA